MPNRLPTHRNPPHRRDISLLNFPILVHLWSPSPSTKTKFLPPPSLSNVAISMKSRHAQEELVLHKTSNTWKISGEPALSTPRRNLPSPSPPPAPCPAAEKRLSAPLTTADSRLRFVTPNRLRWAPDSRGGGGRGSRRKHQKTASQSQRRTDSQVARAADNHL
jgi:hypothetical protein